MTENLNVIQVGLPQLLLQRLVPHLSSLGWVTKEALTAREGLDHLLDQRFDVLLFGTELPDVPAERFLEEALRRQPSLAAVAVASLPDYSEAVRFAGLGAVDYLPNDRLASLDWVDERIRIADLRRDSGQASALDESLPRLVGNSSPILNIKQLVRIIAPRRSTVLITGPTGTGKELVAKAIHGASPRAAKPLVVVNCGAIPDNLVEAEMFGHVKGAFTGAVGARVGRFEQAHGGTIFLDEVSEIPIEAQSKLLRVLQEREFQRVGSSETIIADTRVIAATNRDLKEMVQKREFREDLFYRLNVVPVNLPTLAERSEDLPLLVDHLVAKICRREGLAVKQVSTEALRRLMEYRWPGNVRQLENVIEKAVALSEDRRLLNPSDFPLPALQLPTNSSGAPELRIPAHGLNYDVVMSEFERSLLSQALERSGGNKKRAADLLGIKRTTFAAKWRVLQQAAGAG